MFKMTMEFAIFILSGLQLDLSPLDTYVRLYHIRCPQVKFMNDSLRDGLISRRVKSNENINLQKGLVRVIQRHMDGEDSGVA